MPLDEIINSLLTFGKTHGLFPLGIVIGLILASWANRRHLSYLEKENACLKKDKRAAIKTLKGKDKRIDILHKKLAEKKPRQISGLEDDL